MSACASGDRRSRVSCFVLLELVERPAQRGHLGQLLLARGQSPPGPPAAAMRRPTNASKRKLMSSAQCTSSSSSTSSVAAARGLQQSHDALEQPSGHPVRRTRDYRIGHLGKEPRQLHAPGPARRLRNGPSSRRASRASGAPPPMARTAGSARSRSSGPAVRMRTPARAASATSSVRSRLFPMPASPSMITTLPRPARASASRSESRRISFARPINGVSAAGRRDRIRGRRQARAPGSRGTRPR